MRRGARSAAAAIYSAHGLTGFWRGTAPSVMRMGLGVGLHMVLVENVAAALSARMDSNASPLKDFLTGGDPWGTLRFICIGEELSQLSLAEET